MSVQVVGQGRTDASHGRVALGGLLSDAPSLETRMDEFANAIRHGGAYSDDNRAELARGLCGRILRGRTEADFATLTDNPDRRVVFTFGPDALARMPGLLGVELLRDLAGATPLHICDKFGVGADGKPKNECRLAVFPESNGAFLGTWENVVDTVASAYPEVADTIRRTLPHLMATPFADFEAQFTTLAGVSFKHVDKASKTHPHYMTLDRLRDSAGSPLDVRAFLYFCCSLREQYSGDGFTYNDQGLRGAQEFIVPNRPLGEMPHRLIPISVDVSCLEKD